ncbi:Transcription factor Pcc1, putative [Angomonas deanei]|uniref:Transcription factor Pcc1, putative n=1 Tax=Angomonas deanei TaxID=59799 RepID=A0A7G2C9G4_9TRYP|nr:Transcription factor Pcc1, putative [Angomonas deanei]
MEQGSGITIEEKTPLTSGLSLVLPNAEAATIVRQVLQGELAVEGNTREVAVAEDGVSLTVTLTAVGPRALRVELGSVLEQLNLVLRTLRSFQVDVRE